jgi:hypothetical protein
LSTRAARTELAALGTRAARAELTTLCTRAHIASACCAAGSPDGGAASALQVTALQVAALPADLLTCTGLPIRQRITARSAAELIRRGLIAIGRAAAMLRVVLPRSCAAVV